MTDLDAVTRIRIKTELGAYEFWADHWETEIQDGQRTLHLRGSGPGNHARTQRDMEAQLPTLVDANFGIAEDDE